MRLPENYYYECEGETLKIKGLDGEGDVTKWIDELNKISYITWRVKRTFPRSERYGKLYKFKKLYRCQHDTRPAKTAPETSAKKSSKHTGCPATLKITISREKDEDGNAWCHAIFKDDHNHAINIPSSLRYRPICNETKSEIIELFHRGHTPSSAYATYTTKKFNELGNLSSADRYHFPTKADFYHLWAKEFKKKIGKRQGKNILETLEKYILELNANGHQASLKMLDDRYAVCLITPIMKRAHSLQTASEMIFIDATGNCDVQNHRVYMIAASSGGLGGIPLGCILTNSLKYDIFEEGLKMFIQSFSLQPMIIMTDDDLGERSVISKYFPNSQLLLCTFHILKACWKWLLLKDHNIPKECRQELYYKFKDIVYAQTIEKFHKAEEELKNASAQFPSFFNYVQKQLLKKELWSHCFRKDLFTRGHNASNVIEVMFRIFKDIPLERTKAFNLVQLVDFFATTFEQHCKVSILDTVYERLFNSTLKRMYPNCIKPDTIQCISEMTYTVTCKSKTYKIDMSSGVCSCFVGHKKKLCKHQFAVIDKYYVNNSINTLSLPMKKKYFYIASGKEMEDSSFDSWYNNSDYSFECVNDEAVEECTDDECIYEEAVEECTDDEAVKECADDEAVEECIAVSAIEKSMNDETMDNDEETSSIPNAIESLEVIFNTLKEEVINDPKTMVPAVKKLKENFEKCCVNSTKLVSGIYTAFSDDHANNLNPKPVRHGKKISVQPTVVSLRTTGFTGKRKAAVCGRPSGKTSKTLKEHHYF